MLVLLFGSLNGTQPRAAAPLGPDSLTWRYLGDSRNALLAARAGILQAMHPAINAGLQAHSDFFVNPWNRIIRSAGPILGVVYDEDSQTTGHTVRDFHRPIKGHAPDGSRYAALDPETYFWAHATFFEAQIATQELFGTPLSDTAKVQLYAESITWYERYGVSMRPVPSDYAAFEEYWRQMLDHVLEPTSIARASIRKPKRRLPAPLLWMKGPWAVLYPLLVTVRRGWCAVRFPRGSAKCSRSNGPARTSGDCTRSRSWFAGDGMWRPRVCAGCHELTMPSCEYRGDDEDALDGIPPLPSNSAAGRRQDRHNATSVASSSHIFGSSMRLCGMTSGTYTRSHPFRPQACVSYEQMFPSANSSLARRALDALRLTRSFLTLEDDYAVDWEVDNRDEPYGETPHPHRAPLRGRSVRRRRGQPATAPQLCLSPVTRRPRPRCLEDEHIDSQRCTLNQVRNR